MMIESPGKSTEGQFAEPNSTFDERGYLVLPGLLDLDAVAIVRRMAESTLSSAFDTACARPNNTLVPLRWDDPIVRQFLSSPSVVREIREALRADDLRWISGYLSLKEPRSPALWWHSDWWCWDHPASFRREPAQVAVLTYLDDTTEKNGALRVLPGSHHRSAPIHALLPEAHGDAAVGLSPDHRAMQGLPGDVTLRLARGDAAVLDYRLLHGTHPNGSTARRTGVLLSFTPAWGHLPDELRSHLIQHPALPSNEEREGDLHGLAGLLPVFDGERRSLPMNRNAPAVFETAD